MDENNKENLNETTEENNKNLPVPKAKSKFWTKALSVLLTAIGITQATTIKISEPETKKVDDDNNTHMTEVQEGDALKEHEEALENLGVDAEEIKKNLNNLQNKQFGTLWDKLTTNKDQLIESNDSTGKYSQSDIYSDLMDKINDDIDLDEIGFKEKDAPTLERDDK